MLFFLFVTTKEFTQSAYLFSCITVPLQINVRFVHTLFLKIFMNMLPLSISGIVIFLADFSNNENKSMLLCTGIQYEVK